jgi:hypothetical protein
LISRQDNCRSVQGDHPAHRIFDEANECPILKTRASPLPTRLYLVALRTSNIPLLSQSDLVLWHQAANPGCPLCRRCRGISGRNVDVGKSTRPGCVKTRRTIVSTQQKKRTCSLGESMLRDQDSARINLALEWPPEWFPHSQDPFRTSKVIHSP